MCSGDSSWACATEEKTGSRAWKVCDAKYIALDFIIKVILSHKDINWMNGEKGH